MTQYIEFDEVISKSATETEFGKQPLGELSQQSGEEANHSITDTYTINAKNRDTSWD